MTHWPHWENHCEHPTDSFVGTIRDTNEHGIVDVYVYKKRGKAYKDIYKVCLRYGEEGHQYLSPYGDISTFLFNTDRQGGNSIDTSYNQTFKTIHYRLAAELILSKCEFAVNVKWTPDKRRRRMPIH